MTIQRTDEGLLDMECDHGHELLSEELNTLPFESFSYMVERAREANWRMFHDPETGSWVHLCAEHREERTRNDN